MARTQNLRRQHESAVEIVTQISHQTDAMGDTPTRDQAYAVSMLMAKLTGVLRIHFAQEDKFLYPALIASQKGGVASVARDFFAEMGQIGPLFNDFAQRWASPDAIVGNARSFREESRALFAALADRIKRENDILYPLAEQLADAEGVSARAA